MLSRAKILEAIEELPAEEQEELVSELLNNFSGVKEPPTAPHATRLAGIFANGKRPPPDEEVAQWLNEHGLEKYGQP